MKNFFSSKVLVCVGVLLSCTLMLAIRASAKEYVVYDADEGLNVRSGPGTSCSRIGGLNNGAKVDILGIENGWGRFFFEGKTAWVYMEYLTDIVSDRGLRFIATSEGFREKAYKDSYTQSIINIGYGQTISKEEAEGKYKDGIKESEAFNLLRQSVTNNYGAKVSKFLIANGIKYNQQQFDALVSFTYNLGETWMTDKDMCTILFGATGHDLGNVDKGELTKEFLQWHHAGKNCSLGLLYRRMDELNMFFYGDYTRRYHANPHGFIIPGCIKEAWDSAK